MLNAGITGLQANADAETVAVLDAVTSSLCGQSSLNGAACKGAAAMPSTVALKEIMERLRAAIFPGYFGSQNADALTLRYHMAANLDSIYRMLARQIVSGLCFDCSQGREPCASCEKEGRIAALAFMRRLPHIREMLSGDVKAAYEGDPAAKTPGETIFCYPSITAMFHHRVAHELYMLHVPIIPRIIAEMSHSATGIDIHPGASIGRDFFIDHGTGVVIGETCIIGNGCRIYQGVTLGALSFPKNADGSLTKGIPRHPVLEDNVTVYAGATILGRVTIGKGAVIGGNVWITDNVDAGAKISQERHGR